MDETLTGVYVNEHLLLVLLFLLFWGLLLDSLFLLGLFLNLVVGAVCLALAGAGAGLVVS